MFTVYPSLSQITSPRFNDFSLKGSPAVVLLRFEQHQRLARALLCTVKLKRKPLDPSGLAGGQTRALDCLIG